MDKRYQEGRRDAHLVLGLEKCIYYYVIIHCGVSNEVHLVIRNAPVNSSLLLVMIKTTRQRHPKPVELGVMQTGFMGDCLHRNIG
jgi:hypothetical protein